MTKREAEDRARQTDALRSLGFTYDETEQLRRISMTLRRWHELECGTDHQCITRGWKTNGVFTYSDRGDAYMEVSGTSGPNRYYKIPDRERGAKRRLLAIIAARNVRMGWKANEIDSLVAVHPYIQGDPRGCALYIIRPGDVPEGADVNSYYTRGLAVA